MAAKLQSVISTWRKTKPRRHLELISRCIDRFKKSLTSQLEESISFSVHSNLFRLHPLTSIYRILSLLELRILLSRLRLPFMLISRMSKTLSAISSRLFDRYFQYIEIVHTVALLTSSTVGQNFRLIRIIGI